MKHNAVLKVLSKVPRRGGLQNEAEHAIAVKKLIPHLNKELLSFDVDFAKDLAIIHDVKEIGLEEDIVKMIMLSCTPSLLKGLDALSRKEGESSKEHFKRVLSSDSLEVLVVKMADNLVNARYTIAEQQWHDSHFSYSYKRDRIKYLYRVGMIKERIMDLQIQMYG